MIDKKVNDNWQLFVNKSNAFFLSVNKDDTEVVDDVFNLQKRVFNHYAILIIMIGILDFITCKSYIRGGKSFKRLLGQLLSWKEWRHPRGPQCPCREDMKLHFWSRLENRKSFKLIFEKNLNLLTFFCFKITLTDGIDTIAGNKSQSDGKNEALHFVVSR